VNKTHCSQIIDDRSWLIQRSLLVELSKIPLDAEISQTQMGNYITVRQLCTTDYTSVGAPRHMQMSHLISLSRSSVLLSADIGSL
jgi:hypothetical protein